MKVRPHRERIRNAYHEHSCYKPIESMRLMGRRDYLHSDLVGNHLCSLEEGGTVCQSIEDVDRISWEAEMMKAEEHFDAMDDDECEDCEEEAEGEAWSI